MVCFSCSSHAGPTTNSPYSVRILYLDLPEAFFVRGFADSLSECRIRQSRAERDLLKGNGAYT